MAKSKGRKRKRHREKRQRQSQAPARAPKQTSPQAPAPAPQQTSPRSKLFDRPWKVLLEVVAVVGALASVLALLPRIQLEVTGSIQPSSPLATVFSLANDSVLPIHDVNVICKVDSSSNAMAKLHNVFGPSLHVEVLSPGQKMALNCDNFVIVEGVQTQSAKMTIVASYRPYFVPWHRTIEFPVEAQKVQDGTWLWRRLPC